MISFAVLIGVGIILFCESSGWRKRCFLVARFLDPSICLAAQYPVQRSGWGQAVAWDQVVAWGWAWAWAWAWGWGLVPAEEEDVVAAATLEEEEEEGAEDPFEEGDEEWFVINRINNHFAR